jgi:hypothetical protein
MPPVSRTRRFGPLAVWVVALVIVRSALQAHGFHWTWVAAALLFLMGVAWVLHDLRLRPSTVEPETTGQRVHPTGHAGPPSQPTMIGFRRPMLVFIGVFGIVYTVACGGAIFLTFSEGGLHSGWGTVFGFLMALGAAWFAQWAVFAFRGFRGRPALIIDADGVTDQSFPSALGRVRWDEVEAIHWTWPSSVYATRRFVAIELRSGHTSLGWAGQARLLLSSGAFRSRSIDPAKLAISDEELAHLFRLYSGGRFGIAQR